MSRYQPSRYCVSSNTSQRGINCCTRLWYQALKPPLVDAAGKEIACHQGGKCDLHLHGSSHWQRGTWKTRLGSVYSQAAAPGVILATGNVGEFLSADANSVRQCKLVG